MPTLYLSRLRQIATEVYKVMNNIGPDYVKDIFNVKDNPYNMRNTRYNPSIIQSRMAEIP